jgi:hypothetical protein
MKPSTQKLLLFIGLVLIAFYMGSYIMVATFFGIVTLIGLISLIETIPLLKWVVRKTTALIDILFFVFTIIAVTAYGLNISAALTIAGLGYTLVYAPYVREEDRVKKQRKYMNQDKCNRM